MSNVGAEDFADFFTASRPRLLRALLLLTGDRADAEDALQEAYTRAADRWGQLAEPEAWVRTVALKLARDGHRRKLVRDRAHRRLPEPPTVPDLEPTTVAVVAALRELSQEHREVLVLHYLLDLSVDQVALQLDRPSGTVKAQLARGRVRLAAVLQLEGTTP